MNNNTAYAARNALDGTRTAENLRQAFAKEAENFARSSIFSSLASDEGNISAKRTLMEHSDNDLRHAELWLGYLDELGDTLENLAELSAVKSALSGDLYPLMAQIADEEGFDEIAEKMRLVAAVKDSQSRMLDSEKDKIMVPDTMYADDPETVWHCSSCGYDIHGNMPPERCPLCSYPEDFFERA